MKGRSKILDELTRVGRSTRLGTRAAALQNTSDPGLRVLALAAAIPPEEQVVIRVATHFVGSYLMAVHGAGAPEMDEPAAVEDFAVELRKVRRAWRKRRAAIQTVEALAADEVLGMLKMLRHHTGIHDEPEVRAEVGAVIRGFFVRVAYREKGVLRETDVAMHHLVGDPSEPDRPEQDYAVTRPAWAGDLEEAGKATAGDPIEPEVTGDRARVRSNPGDPSSGNLPDRYSEVLEIIRETRLDRLPEGSA